MKRIGTAVGNMTSNHRGIEAGSAFCWLYACWAGKNPELAKERGIEPLPANATVIEVGNGGLHSLGYLCDVAPAGWTIVAVDPYLEHGRFIDMLQTATTKLGDVIDRVKILRWPSPQSVRLFKDDSVDAVLIDGDHDEAPVRADIAAWWPTVKPGGYLAGDDVDPMFPGCEAAWQDAFPDVACWGSTAVVRVPW
jgi:hypothetical protein